jgi:uncharacterized repeat protein (TIGR02543 family)
LNANPLEEYKMEKNLYMKIIASVILGTFLVTMFFPLVQSQIDKPQTTPTWENLNWWNTQWPYRKLITIDDSLVSAGLTNFPVLISEPTDLDLAAGAQPNGQDIVFIWYNNNATILNHEIEFYDHLNGQLIAWVNTPTLSPTSDTRLWMYYGNPNAGDQQHVEATWDANFLAVHHLEETTGIVYDSTAYNNDGTPYGALNQDVTGKIDGADFFDGIDDRIILPSVYTTETQFTIETWIYAEAGARHFISQRSDASQGVFIQILGDNTLQYYINGISHITGILLNTWYYIALTYNGTNADLYLNGFESSIPCTPPTWPSVTMCLGDRPAGDRQFHGTMDEVRFSNIARTCEWINTVYANQNSPEAFISIGTEEPYEYTLTLTANPPAGGSIGASPDPPYYYNDLVTLTATANPGYTFSHWSGDLTGTLNPATLLIDEDKTVTAHFTQIVYTLTINVDPLAGGSVDADPSPPYHYNDVVNLTATANPGYSFDQWSGDASGSNPMTTVTMNGNKAVTASFIFENTPPVAMNDSATVLENSINNSVDVLVNDNDSDGDILKITAVTQPLQGTSSQDGSYVYYTPFASYIGSDSFTYTISDGAGGNATATVFITVVSMNNTPPYAPNHPVPENGETNVSITTDLGWIGGDPDADDTVCYDVYFGTMSPPPLATSNQTTSTYDPGTLANDTTYYWQIVSTDNHNASTQGPEWQFTTQKQQVEEGIIVNITRPLKNSFYLRNFRLLPLPRNTIIYGPITIKAKVTADAEVEKVEFYIDEKLRKTDTSAPYTYRWAPLRSFRHTITVRAYDTNGHTASDEITVFKWRLHPVILLGGAALITGSGQ